MTQSIINSSMTYSTSSHRKNIILTNVRLCVHLFMNHDHGASYTTGLILLFFDWKKTLRNIKLNLKSVIIMSHMETLSSPCNLGFKYEETLL